MVPRPRQFRTFILRYRSPMVGAMSSTKTSVSLRSLRSSANYVLEVLIAVQFGTRRRRHMSGFHDCLRDRNPPESRAAGDVVVVVGT